MKTTILGPIACIAFCIIPMALFFKKSNYENGLKQGLQKQFAKTEQLSSHYKDNKLDGDYTFVLFQWGEKPSWPLPKYSKTRGLELLQIGCILGL